jgi:hypothetical protein
MSVFFVHFNLEPGTAAEIVLLQTTDAGMSHWRKRNPSARWFNAALARWSVVFSVIFATLVVLQLRGHL